MSTLDDMAVDLTVVLGRNRMPIHMLLRMGRGAVIELEATETDMVEVLANGYPVARGQIVVTGSRIAVEITEIIKKPKVIRAPGTRIGDASEASLAATAFENRPSRRYLPPCGGGFHLLEARGLAGSF